MFCYVQFCNFWFWMGVFLVLHALMRGQGCRLVLYSLFFLLARGYTPPVGDAIVVISFKL